MTTLLLVRHGRSSANTAGILAGHTAGVTLDEVGQAQASGLAERLTGVTLARVVSSPLERCVQTAAAFAGELARGIETDRSIIECDYGDWTGRPLSELALEPLWADVQRFPSQVVFPGGESLAAFDERVRLGVAELERTTAAEFGPDAVWALVTHADVVKAILAHALDLPFDRFQRLLVDPASVSVVSFGHAFPVVAATNSRSGAVKDLLPAAMPVVPGGGTGAASA